ncbi:MAG: glycoside hydrolase family 2 protein [Oscillospiraceae bacterium]|nr:glycoside hydrolase family 2 protein [Oscillospiraceae bacterium]
MRGQNWNDNWLFWEDKDAFALIWSVPEHAQTVRLPHDVTISLPAYGGSPAGGDGAFRDGGSYVYVKNLFAPEEWRDRTVSLRFDGVSRNAMVYVNGQRAAVMPYAYTTFDVPLDDFLDYGKENQIRVSVRTGDMPNTRWYAGSGIYRDVSLWTGGLVSIPAVRVSTQSLDPELALVTVETELRNRMPTPRQVCLKTELLAPDGALAASEVCEVTLMGGGQETLTQTLPVPEPRPWSAETPERYLCRSMLLLDGGVSDRAETAFGIRTLTVDSKRGLRINGKTVKLRGACIHHDSGLLGAATFAEAEHRRIRLLKEAGFNAVRSAHQPLAPAALEACDALGIYVMDEAFDMWTRSKKDYDYSQFFEKWWQDDLAAMVRKDFNHPSVILYSIGNEIPEIATPHGAALGRRMASLVRSLDRTRPVMAGINGIFASGDRLGQIVAGIEGSDSSEGQGGNVNDFMAATAAHADEIAVHPIISRNLELAGAGMDVMGYNYMTARYEPDGRQYPNRVIVGSETYPPEIARSWDIIQKSPQVIGDFTWTGWDYLGEAGVGVPAYRFGEGGFGAGFPCQLSYCGDLDLTGFRRPASYFREIVFGLRKSPYITVQNPDHYGETPLLTPWVLSDNGASWTHPGFEGKPVVVEVYTPGDTVELFQNGASLGRRPAGAQTGFRVLFETVYQPGMLEAVAYDNGAELGRSTLSTAGPACVLKARLEPAEGLPERELIFVRLTLEDARGRLVPCSDCSIQARAEGDVVLAALGSGDPKPLAGYTDGVSRTFQGRALAILRTVSSTGSAVLNVSAGEWGETEVSVTW